MMITKKDRRIIRYASRILDKSFHPDYHMCAILTKSNKILSIGINRKAPKKHYVPNNVGEIGRHAEIDCLHLVSKEKTKGTILYVLGRTAAKNYIKSKPCSSCFKIIKDMNISKVVYHGIDGTLYKIKVN